MKHATEPPSTGGLSIFEKACGYCGARFRVLLAQGPQADRTEEYACPECGKRYEAAGAEEAEVRLLQKRSDGKRDRYQDTLF
jgi:DNA-directed RNA polymerase subunit RPC12/RpoP